MANALVVDDDRSFAPAVAEIIRQEGFEVSTADSLRAAREHFAAGAPDVALVDLVLPDGNGIDFIREIHPASTTKVLVMTGHAAIDSAIAALRVGVVDFLTKPLDLQQLKAQLRNLKGHLAAVDTETDGTEDEAHGMGSLLGEAPSMRRLYRMIAKAAPTNTTVLLYGESGTGKELAAQAIHEWSRRRCGPFLALNCGAVAPALIGSELFGHERGSFTGAARQHAGYFERAAGGTLFLDEITEMPLELQVQLLRVLEGQTLMRIGGTREINVDVRVIAATNRPPARAVAEGKLRQDLYFRLMVFPMYLPPLRVRRGDVALLAAHFLAAINAVEGTDKRFSPEAMARLEAHRWPGNVRELKNTVQHACILADREITPEHLPQWLHGAGAPDHPLLDLPVGMPIERMERRLILATLEYHKGNKRRAAQTLGVSLKTLYNRLNAYQEAEEL